MADSSVPITAGAGTSVDTRTEATNGNHRQVMVIGDPSVNAGVAPVDATNGLSVNITNGSIAVTGAFTEYTEDSAADADPTGIINMLVRADTPGAIASANGDNLAQRGTNYGAGFVQVVNSSGAFVDSFGGGTQYTEGDADATITGTATMMEVAANTLQPIQGTVADGLLVNLGANNDVTVTGTVTVGSHAVTNAGTFAVQNTAATPAGTNNIGDVDVLTINGVAPAFGTGVRGATVQRVTIATDDSVPVTGTFYQATQPVSAASLPLPSGAATSALQTQPGVDIGDVTINNASGASAVNIQDGGNSITVDGTVAVSGTVATSMATNTPVGNVAHDAADSGAPIKTGGRARTTEITAVASDDRVDSIHDKVGKQVVLPYSIPESFVSGAITTAMTATTTTSLVAAPAAGLRNYLTTIIVSNAHATVGTDVIIQDGSGGTTLMTIPAAAVYGGAVITLPTPLRQPTTATAIFCANVTTGASTKVSAVGYTGA